MQLLLQLPGIRVDVALMCLHDVSHLPDDDVDDSRFRDVREGVLFALLEAMEKASVNEMGTKEKDRRTPLPHRMESPPTCES
jgi:hypothetical protein